MSRITVRDLIINSCDEARLVNRSQPIPGNIFISAYTLLQKRLAQYSNTNLLSFTRKELDIETDKNDIMLGTYELKDVYQEGFNFWTAKDIEDLPAPSADNFNMMMKAQARVGKDLYKVERYRDTPSSFAYRWIKVDVELTEVYEYIPDFEVESIQEITKVYRQFGNEYSELKFVSYEDFYDWTTSSDVFTVLPIDDDHVKIKTHLKGNVNLKVIYNEPFEFDQDSELNVPRQFVALFTAGLVYDLALQYPRLSDNTVAMLKNRLDELEENVRRSSAVNKLILREVDKRSLSYSDFISGKFLFRG